MKNKIFAILAAISLSMTLTSCEIVFYFWYDNPVDPADDPTEIVHISGVKIVGVDNATATLVKGKTLQLSAEVMPANTPEKGVNWVSENTAVATVTQEGLVTAVAKGTTFVSVVSKANASVSAKITVTVIDGEIDVNTTPVDQSNANSRKQ